MKQLLLSLGIAVIVGCTPVAAVDPEPASGVKQGVPVSTVAPLYPHEALMRGTPGWVRLGFHINGDGTVSGIRVIESEPGRLFVASARRALEQWRFDPADEGPATYTIHFEVDSSAHDH